ncbi:DUF1080 domain-containing protein [Bremerella cremea]|uniref:Protein kinase domain-containing protein n=1 Tax=Blastopirellula marina TaxID=124 RepID=A0A2S8FYA8_9BACT|nr:MULTISPECIES: family 16 glycoside hydrolase [Pirellulaceae]PQO37175.1 hypothetical protein C5Y83_04250 [Blastopirellula marina]RCS49562.1 DUF1080 domain-containing protein [Bremerella cremea]
MTSPQLLSAVSDTERNQLEQLLMTFEETWTPEQILQVGEMVSAQFSPTARLAALFELAQIDLHRSWEAGKGRQVEFYLQQFPDLSTDPQIPPHLLASEYEARSATGNQQKESQYRERFANCFPQFVAIVKQNRQQASAALATNNQAASDTHPQQPDDFTNLPVEFGRYRILKQLGTGAMGKVYLAHDTQLDRQVALKTPQFRSNRNEELITRFYREARSAAKLQHRNICQVYDVGEIDGRHFISMAFIDGRCLADYIASGKQSAIRSCCILVLRLANGLSEAHRHNVVHRDLKPGNVMVDQKQEPVIMDFGLALQTDSQSRMTHEGSLLGSPAYMSPEQIQGKHSQVGPTTDIYALGVIFYELLTGELPFQASSLGELAYKIISTDPPKLSTLRADVDPTLAAIVEKMMAREAAERYQSMEEVAQTIRQYLSSATAIENETPSRATQADMPSPVPTSQPIPVAQPVPAAKPIPSEQPSLHNVAAQLDVAPQKTSQRFSGRRAKPIWPWIVGASLCGGLLILAAVMLLKTPYGTLRIETIGDLPNLEVLVDGNVVRLNEPNSTSATEHQLQLKLGEATLALAPGSNAFVLNGNGPERRISVQVEGGTLTSDKLTVARNGVTLLKLQLLPSDEPKVASSSKTPSTASPAAADASSSPMLPAAFPTGDVVAPFPAPGFDPLFNGKNLDGWDVFGHSGWSVQNGELVGTAPNDQNKVHGWLMNRGDFEDFELRLEYRLPPGGNSGVYIRAVPNPSEINEFDMNEVQLLDDTSLRYDDVRPNMRNAALWKVWPASPSLKLPPNQWHRLAIRVQGDGIQIWSNDVKVTAGKLPSEKSIGKKIGLQLMSSEVRFRNIQVRKLGATTPARPSKPSITESEPGFLSLFNHRDLSGWQYDGRVSGLWSVQDGLLQANKAYPDWPSFTEDLLVQMKTTQSNFRDFELRLRMRIASGGYCGVVLRRQEQEAIEVSFRPDRETKTMVKFWSKIAMKQREDSVVTDFNNPSLGPGEWFDVQISLVNDTLSVVVDNQKVLVAEVKGNKNPGPIELVIPPVSNGNVSFAEIAIKPLGALPATSNVPTEAEFTSLIGKDLSGWAQLGSDGWSVRNGILIGNPPPNQPRFKRWLMNTGSYENFELQFEYQLEPGGNSGVFIRAVRDAALSVTGDFYEVQLLDDTAPKYAKDPTTHLNGALWKALPASPGLRLPPKQWHRMTIRAQGDQLQVWSNDQKIVDGKLPRNTRPGTRIGLQLHTGKVMFRDLRIRELPSR